MGIIIKVKELENGLNIIICSNSIKQNSKLAAIHVKDNFDIKNLVDFIYDYNIENKCFIFSTLQDYNQLKKFENIKH